MELSSTIVGPNTKNIKFEKVTPSEAVYFTRIEALYPKLVKVRAYGTSLEVEIILKED